MRSIPQASGTAGKRSFASAILRGAFPLLLAAAPASAQELPLAIELDGTRVAAGSLVELVLRTAEARPLGAAGIDFEVRDRDGIPAVAFATLDSWELLSGGAAATADATFDAATQRLHFTAASPDGDLNTAFGPLAAFRFTLHAAVELGDRFEIWVDPDTQILDAAAEPVATLVGRADLRIIDPDPTQGLGALGGEAFPGAPVLIGAVTERPFAIGGGTVELFYDAALFAPGSTVTIDADYGSATIDGVSEPEPGHLVITFTSPGDDLNLELHGPFLTVALQSLAEVPVGTVSTVVIGAATALVDPDGAPIDLEIDSETIDFIAPEVVARAGFEAANFTEWWAVEN